MMKKSLIALAVAGVVAAPAAFAATSNVDVYGQVRVSVDSVDNDNIGYTVNDQSSRLGIKGSEDLGGGMSAIWQWETGIVTDGKTQTANDGTANVAAVGGIGTQRNTFIGLKGAFGTVLAGTHDTPYKLAGSADVFGDTSADSQKSTTGIIGRNGLDIRAANAVAYISPDYNGFHAAAAMIPNESAAAGGANAGRSIALVYVNGPLKATFAQEKYHAGREGNKFNVAYKIGDIGLGATYEKSNSADGAAKDKAYLVSATYGMGPITLAAQYGNFNDSDDSDNTVTGFAAQTGEDIKRSTVGAIYALSKRTNAAIAYSNDDKSNGSSADSSTKTWTVQLNHSF